MRGTVLTPPADASGGLIEGADHRRYRFATTDVSRATPQAGATVIFVPEGDEAREVEIERDDEAILATGGRNWFAFFFSPMGRVGRRDFWVFGFPTLLVAGLLIREIGGLLALPAILIHLWSGIALSSRRCHDVGRTGWWAVLPWICITPLVLTPPFTEVSRSAVELAAFAVFGAGLLLSVLWLLFAIQIQPGQSGPNRFGPDPKGT